MKLCVFCGASPGNSEEFTIQAKALGKELVSRDIGLVYGGGTVGLMGTLALTVHEAGGSVTGIIPEALKPREISGPGVGEVIVVQDMHTRKANMAELSNGFIAMPGGFGTFEELFEVITWAQLGIHNKPIGCLNVNDYFGPLQSLIENGISSGFIKENMRDLVIFESDPKQLVDRLLSHKPPESMIKWLTEKES